MVGFYGIPEVDTGRYLIALGADRQEGKHEGRKAARPVAQAS